MGKILIIVGLSVTMIGVTLMYFPNALKWFGNLPGDINIQNENSSVYIPITSMIIVSLVLSLVMRLLR